MPGPAGRTVSVAERDYTNYTVTIADGASLSGAVDLRHYTLVGVITDAAWDTNSMSFAVATSLDGTYVPLHTLTTGAEVVAPGIVASKWFAADPADFAGVRFLKVRSGTSGTPVNQAGATVVTLVVRGV